MDYEQKYKEMKARVLAMGRGYVKGLDYSKPRQIAEYIDPDLKEESDGEKIRKELLQIAKESEDSFHMVMTPLKREKLIAWLEGQKDYIKVSSSAHTSRRDVVEFADKYSHAVWEKLMDKFEKIENYWIGCNDVSDIVLNAIINTYNWLEKQRKEKPADKVESKFHKGEWILNNVCLPVKIDSIEDGMYIFTDGNALSVAFVDETYHLWNTQDDVKDGDVLYTSSTASHETFVFKNIDENGNAKCYFAYDSEDGFCEGEYHFIGRAKDCKPATKKQRDLLFRKMREKGYEWDAEKKELKKIGRKPVEKIEPKPIEDVNGEDYGIDGLYHAKEILEKTLGNVEGYQSDDGILEHKCAISAVKELSERKPVEWTEEDSFMLSQAIKCVNNSGKLDVSTEEIEDWLRNLNPQPRQGWSEEDEKTLHSILTCIEYCYNEDTEAQYNGNHCVDPKRYGPMSDWLKSLKTRIQSKHEWSEEDEKMKLRTIELIAKYWNSLPDTDCAENEISESCYNWLQSLRTNPHWKPSKAEIEALEMATDALKIYTSYVPLVSLCSELKKL